MSGQRDRRGHGLVPAGAGSAGRSALMAVAMLLLIALGSPLAGATGTPPAPRSVSPVVWLCRPGQAHDPCTPGLSTTVYSPTLKRLGTTRPVAVKRPAIDCFYVYPTVSDQTTGNANLTVDPEERSIALYQAARYSQYCRVYAPMYRQETLAGIGEGTPTTKPSATLAYDSLAAAFRYYLSHDNRGRGFVLIGHSQGSFILRELISRQIDPDPSLRARLVSAILLGGNVLVKPGARGIGGDFHHIPACRSDRQTGCVIAWSTFDQPVPADSIFGRPTGTATGAPAPKGDIVLCTNPAWLSGGSGLLDPILPSAPFAPGTLLAAGMALLHVQTPDPAPSTVWYTLPGSYEARCSSADDAHVLQITPVGGAQLPTASPTPAWGLHLLDANIGLGNLLSIVKAESAAYGRRHPGFKR